MDTEHNVGPARCTLEQLRARWGRLEHWRDGYRLGVVSFSRPDSEVARECRLGDLMLLGAMGGEERWRVEKIEGKRVDLVQEASHG